MLDDLVNRRPIYKIGLQMILPVKLKNVRRNLSQILHD